MLLLWVFCLSFVRGDLEIILQELDHVIITEDAEDTPLIAFTHSNFEDQPTRIFNNIDEITHFTLTVDSKSYLFATFIDDDSIIAEFKEDDDT